MRRACLVALLTLAVVSGVTASRILEDDAAVMGRQLLQSADRTVCSTWCETNQCIRVGTTGLVKCNLCKSNMKPILSGVNAGQCGCPAGTYFNSAAPGGIHCIPCEFGKYCNKQLTWVSNTASGIVGRSNCPDNLTTRTRRSTSIWDCVNTGGYALTLNNNGPSATKCADNTYAIAKSKQSTCTPCPPGYVVWPTNDARDKPTACKVPPGYFLKSPGQIAPCDQGSFQDKYLTESGAAVGACQACPEGVTTANHSSTLKADCKKLKPGYVATAIAAGTDGITTAVLCPQGWYCPGDVNTTDDATAVIISWPAIGTDGTADKNVATISLTARPRISQCPNKAWTKTVGATRIDQCMVPPGYEILGSADISPCTSGDGIGKYRSEWISIAKAAADKCVACGDGIGSEAIEPITLYTIDTGATDKNTDYLEINAKVTASSKSCYILKGQGMYYVPSGTPGKMIYKARNCGVDVGSGAVANSYGVAGAKVYGLAQSPCKLCPAGTKADTAITGGWYTAYKATNGFFDPLACVTKPGYGWDGRVATLCAKGWYNEGNNYKACTQCAYGLTTDTPDVNGLKTDNIEDCQIAPGFGMYDTQMQLCPVGYYNSVLKPTTGTEAQVKCGACAGNSWTEEEGSDASTDCTVCKPGYGGADTLNCAACGGDDVVGQYGPPGRNDTLCVACPMSQVGFQFFYNNAPQLYISPARAVAGAQDASDCVSALGQIEDGLWYLSATDAANVTSMADFDACVTSCLNNAKCALMSYDYANADANSKCKVLEITDSGSIITAFKALPSSDVSQSRRLLATKPKAVSTGMYTQWGYDGTGKIGAQTDATGTISVKAECFTACDDDDACAGVVWNPTGTVCKLIKGITAPDSGDAPKRSLTKAVPSKFALAA